MSQGTGAVCLLTFSTPFCGDTHKRSGSSRPRSILGSSDSPCVSEKGRNAGGKEAGRVGGSDTLPVPTHGSTEGRNRAIQVAQSRARQQRGAHDWSYRLCCYCLRSCRCLIAAAAFDVLAESRPCGISGTWANL